MLGTYKMVLQNPSHSLGNKNVNIQTTQSVEHYLRVDEIPTLPQGYFAGKLAEGDSVKFMGPVDVSEYADDFTATEKIKMPLGPSVTHLYNGGDISVDDIHKYYKGDKKSNDRINREVLKYAGSEYKRYAGSEYKRIKRESNMFLMQAGVAEAD